MKKIDLTTKSATELHTLVKELQGTLGKLRFDLADKRLTQTSEIRKTRISIARALTALNKAK